MLELLEQEGMQSRIVELAEALPVDRKSVV